MANGPTFLAELKRRRVVRVAVVYCAGAFVALQAADIMLPRLGVPEWALSLLVVLAILGLAMAILLGWALELTPEGLRVTPRAVAAAAGSPPSLLGRRTVLVAGALMVLGTGLGAGWFLRPAAAPAAAAAEPAMAVLPFDNYSPDPADAYFAGGITEEITSQLSRLSGLRVMSRTAVARAMEGSRPLADMAAELGVASILEGSVRVAGDRVRITTQLVDPGTGQHLWAEDYDRDLADIFAIQRDVALAIVGALRARVAPDESERMARVPTDNLAAYQLYLRDSQLPGNVPADNRLAIELLREALALDPRFQKAWSRLAWRYGWEALHGDETAPAKAMEYSGTALELDPFSPDAHRARASAHIALEQYAESQARFRRALELDPNHRSALLDGGWIEAMLGNQAEGLRLSARALRTLPNVPNVRYHVGLPMLLMDEDERLTAWLDLAAAEGMEHHRLDLLRIELDVRRGAHDQALARLRDAAASYSGHPEFEWVAADLLQFLGHSEDARATKERFYATSPDAPTWLIGRTARTNLALLVAEAGDAGRAHELLEEALRANLAAIASGSDARWRRIDIATIHAARGDRDAALDWLERAYEVGYREHRLLRQDRAFEALRGDTRFDALLARMEQANTRERARVRAEGVAAEVDAMIAAGPSRRDAP
jgi:TolB-like protein